MVLLKKLNMIIWVKIFAPLTLVGLLKKQITILRSIPSVTDLATIAALNDVTNKIPNVSDLVKKQIMMQKQNMWRVNISQLLIFITNEILDVMIKNKNLVNKSDIAEFIKNTDLDEKIQKIGNKSRIKSRAR